jgi:hypothetical protein
MMLLLFPRVMLALRPLRQVFCLMGALDPVASIVTCCFCVTYALVNLSCLVWYGIVWYFMVWYGAFGAYSGASDGGSMRCCY